MAGRVTEAEVPKDSVEDTDTSLLESFIGYNLRRAAAKQRERFRSVFEPFDIRPVQLTALTVLMNNHPLRQSALGKALEMKGANVVKLLDELQGRGLVERVPADSDRRAYEVHLTAEGKKLTRRMLAIHDKLEKNLALSLGPEELEQLVALLRKFRTVESDPKL